MSNNQIKIAINMIETAQREMGHNFDLKDFEELIEIISTNNHPLNKDAQSVILNMVESKYSEK